MAKLTQQRLFFAITLIIISISPFNLQADPCPSNEPESYEVYKTTPAPSNPTYERIARTLSDQLGLFATSHDTLSIITWPDAPKGSFATTSSVGIQGRSYRHYFIRINEAACAPLTPDELEFIMTHEVMHIHLKHHHTRNKNSPAHDLYAQERQADSAAAVMLGNSHGAISFFEKQRHVDNSIADTHPSYAQRIAYLKELDLLT